MLTLKTRCLLFFNEFRKNPVLKIAYIIYFLPTFAWSVYSFVNSLIYKEIFFGLCFTLVVSLIYFVFFAFISYEFGRMDSSVGFDECCSAIKFGRVKTIGARILVMISLSIPCFILNLLFFIVVGIVCGDGAAATFHALAHVVIAFVLYRLLERCSGLYLQHAPKEACHISYCLLLLSFRALR